MSIKSLSGPLGGKENSVDLQPKELSDGDSPESLVLGFL